MQHHQDKKNSDEKRIYCKKQSPCYCYKFIPVYAIYRGVVVSCRYVQRSVGDGAACTANVSAAINAAVIEAGAANYATEVSNGINMYIFSARQKQIRPTHTD